MRNARRIGRLALIVVVAAGVMLLPAGAARATFPGPDGRIAFWDFMTGQVYSVNPDGTGLLQLTHVGQGQTAASPGWSPDGTHIAFDSDMTGEIRLFEMDADGTHQHMLMRERPGYADFFPRFTPDGTRVVFSRCPPDSGCAIWSVRADGTDRMALTPFQGDISDFFSVVSPDGASIAFTRFGAGGIISQVYMMGADGSNAHALTPPRLEGFFPDWSPSGQRIAFSSNCCKLNSDAYVMGADGSQIHRLTHTPFPNNTIVGSYSPQGDRMVVHSDRRYPDLCCVDLFVMNANGTGKTLLDTGLLGSIDPQWGSAPAVASNPGTDPVLDRRSAGNTWRAHWCAGIAAVLEQVCRPNHPQRGS